MLWSEKWTSEEFLDMLTGKLNMVIPPLSGSNAKFVGVLFLECFDIIMEFVHLFHS